MNRTLLSLAALAAALLLPAAETPTATPGTAPDFPERPEIWINGGIPVKSDFSREKAADSFSGTILRKLGKQPETGEFAALYEFNAPKAGDYDFFAALVTQRRAHASPVEFRFDGGEWREVPDNPSGKPAWGISNAVSWNPLGSVKLKAGNHTLEFRITKRAQLGSWSFMCDGVAGFLNAPAPLAPAANGPVPTLKATPGAQPELPKQGAIWINGGTPEKSNIGTRKVGDSFSKTILYMLSPSPAAGVFEAVYTFEVRKEADYDFFAALITQGRAHGSPVEFRFDGEPFHTVRPNPESRPAWGVSNAISWDWLGSRRLAAGTHTLTLRMNRRAQLGSWSFMCDGIIGLEKGTWKTAEITGFAPPSALTPGESAALAYRQSGQPFPAELRLTFAGEPVVSTGFMSGEGENIVPLELPAMLPAGEYRLELAPLDDPRRTIASAAASVPRAPSPLPARLTGVELDRRGYTLKFEDGKMHPVLVMAFYDGRLYGAARLETASGTLPEEIAKLAAGRGLELRFRPLPARPDNTVTLPFTLAGPRKKLPKPVNYGSFEDRDKILHTWYMNHDFEYIFDGERYFPVGGMWCPDTLINRDGAPAGVASRLARDLGTIRAIRKGGLDDVYLNLSTQAPLWVRQAFADMLEAEGIHYGYQLTAGGGDPIPSFFITRDRADAPGNYRGLTRGTYASGRVTGRFPAEQKLAGLLVVDPARPQQGARFAAFTDKVGKDLRHGIIDLETEQDFGKLREITFPVTLGSPDNTEVILIPLLESKMHHANLWDQEAFAALKERLSWIGRINWGKNLRFIVDPIKNETDMVNGTENLRQYTPAINRAFAAYLKKRYGTQEALRKAWGLDAGSFEEAARLIPLDTGKAHFWIDPETGKILTGDPEQSFAWIDYQEMIRTTYSALADEIAAYLKSLVNVPVIFKSVGVIGEKMSVSRRYLGCDGIGFECYLNQGTPGETGGGASRAEAEASEHTMWKVGTEVGHSAAVGNGGTKFFRDEAELRGMAENLARLGVRGFYFFGFDLKPGNLWSNHNYHDFPEGLAWAARIDREFAAPGKNPVTATPRNYVFPGGFTWWWWTTRYKAFHGYEQNLIPQSARLAGAPLEWYSSTNTLPEEFDAVIINCPRPPFSRYHAEEIEKAISGGRPVSYVGSRADLGAIPLLDRFFTEETIRFADGSAAQVLRSLPGSEVLAAEDGKPWAIRSGSLTIVSRAPETPPVNHADEFLRYLSEITAKK
ncbi:MAG: hypothetical protein HPZ91_05305 [Lentisphaeria bacterium]|nr:hypothetical protein [Lentisphaeria bacterium]